VAAVQQVADHGRAHDAESDESDLCHDFPFLSLFFPVFVSWRAAYSAAALAP
jgi:hypothetical protein